MIYYILNQTYILEYNPINRRKIKMKEYMILLLKKNINS